MRSAGGLLALARNFGWLQPLPQALWRAALLLGGMTLAGANPIRRASGRGGYETLPALRGPERRGALKGA